MRLNHVTLWVSDLDRSVAFYKLLGLRQIVADEDYARFELPDGDSTLSLESRGTERPGGVSVYFECDDLDERVAALKDDGIDFVRDPADMPYLWREAVLADPDGHRLVLFAAGENRLNPPWKLAGPEP